MLAADGIIHTYMISTTVTPPFSLPIVRCEFGSSSTGAMWPSLGQVGGGNGLGGGRGNGEQGGGSHSNWAKFIKSSKASISGDSDRATQCTCCRPLRWVPHSQKKAIKPKFESGLNTMGLLDRPRSLEGGIFRGIGLMR